MAAKTTTESRDYWLSRLLGTDFLLWSPNIQAEGFLHWDWIFATRPIRCGSRSSGLRRATEELDVVFEDQGRQCNIDDLMRDEHLSGLIVLQDDQILLERYALGLTPQLRWQSSSMVKSLTSTLVGAALYDGLIGSLDDEITDYLPEFDNTSYQGVTLRHLLNMTSQGYLTAADSTCSVWTHQAL